MTPFLGEKDRRLSFPPRFGEHNHEIYGQLLGYSDEKLSALNEKGII
jgi:formyl-CoA transferase